MKNKDLQSFYRKIFTSEAAFTSWVRTASYDELMEVGGGIYRIPPRNEAEAAHIVSMLSVIQARVDELKEQM